jgi:hypothetical protein
MLRYGPFRSVRTMLFFDGDELRDFRFGSKGDIRTRSGNVRSIPQSRRWRSTLGYPQSARSRHRSGGARNNEIYSGLCRSREEAGSSIPVPAAANASVVQTSIMTWMLSANASLQLMELASAAAGCCTIGLNSHSRGSHADMRNLWQRL